MFLLKMLDANILAEVQKMKGGKMDKSDARRTNEKLRELSGFFGFKLIIQWEKRRTEAIGGHSRSRVRSTGSFRGNA